MSEVIQDMEIGVPPKGPYAILDHALRLGIFSNGSVISYSQYQIRIIARQKLDDCFQLISNILLQKRQVSLNSSLMRNGKYIVIDSSQLRKNLYRSFIKTSFEPTIKILINQQGRIKIKMHTFLTTQVEFRQTKQTQKIYKFVQKLYTQMMQKFNNVFHKIKLLLEPTYEKLLQTNQDRLQKLDIIKNTCRFLYVKPSFMACDGQRGKNNHQNLAQQFIPQNQLDVTNIFEMKVESDKTVDNMKYNFFIQLWEASLQLQKVEDTSLYHNFNLVKIKEMYKSSLRISDSKNSKNCEIQQVFSQIHISDIQKVNWTKIYEGGFGYLYKANLSFYFVKEKTQGKNRFLHQKPIQKAIVMKTDRNNNSKVSRIQIQRIILKSLKGKRTRYLPNFYQCIQTIPNHRNYILTDFYPMKSLDNWFKNHGEFISIFTKISFIMYICHGIYFLHENKIVHRDIKIANVLVDTKMIAKLIDFGQSYHQSTLPYLKSKGKDCKPGYTLPYSPPQVFGKNEENTKKFSYDIFSLGFTIYEIMFGKSLLIDINDIELKKIYMQEGSRIDTKYSQQSGRIKSLIKQKIYLASQSLEYFGPTQLLTPILNVIQRCLDPKIENRPYLEWVIVIMKETYGSLLDFYSL